VAKVVEVAVVAVVVIVVGVMVVVVVVLVVVVVEVVVVGCALQIGLAMMNTIKHTRVQLLPIKHAIANHNVIRRCDAQN